jgi:CubicO group peptidase (beta-lactamase class C family)
VTEAAAAAFPRAMERLEVELEDGTMLRGAQVCVSVGGDRVLDVAVGDAGAGTTMSPDTVFRAYCAMKPVTALAVARLVDDGALDLDLELGSVLPSVEALAPGDVTLRSVLNHTAGLQRPAAFEIEVVPEARRRQVVDRAGRPPHWKVGRQAGYSEFVGWHLIGRLLEAVTGEELRTHLRADVIEPLGLTSTWVGMTEDDYERVESRLGVNWDLRGHRPVPVLLERARRWCLETNCAYGGYTTARDLDRFYRAVLQQVQGAGVDRLPSASTMAEFVSNARPRTYDEVLARECDYGLGFMVDLAGHHFGRACSPSSFGHSGWLGGTFAFADPDHDLVVAAVLNGIVDSETSFVRRPSFVRAIYTDLGLYGDRPAEAATPEEPAPGRRSRFRRRGVG